MKFRRLIVLAVVFATATLDAQRLPQPDWPCVEEETLQFQSLVRFDTTDPPGGERPAAEYLKQVLDREGISTELFALEAKGVQCYGIAPALDAEDGPLGFGAHSDQERILEQELYRFVRFHYDVVAGLAIAR